MVVRCKYLHVHVMVLSEERGHQRTKERNYAVLTLESFVFLCPPHFFLLHALSLWRMLSWRTKESSHIDSSKLISAHGRGSSTQHEC